MKYIHRDLSECRYQAPGLTPHCPETFHEVISDAQFVGWQEINRLTEIVRRDVAEFMKKAHEEAWLYYDPEALASVRRGLQQAREGRGRVLSFAQYADED